jgi:CheY-like chemotaxis protein
MKKLLLAEDNEDTAELTEKMITILGYQVTVARNGMEAVAKANAEIPDLILMDIHMPLMDGFQALEEIRKTPRTTAIPALAVSAGGSQKEVARYRASGFNDFLAKPYTLRELADSIKKLLGESNNDRG